MLLPLAALLNGIGYVFIARLNPDLAGLQAVWTGLGIAAFVATLAVVRRTRDLERYRYSFALLGVGLLMMPLLPVVGRNINGSRLWIRFGTVTFQPGELAKIVLAIFFAAYLVEKRELLSEFRISRGRLPNPRAVGPIALAWAASLLVMVAERDLGSSLLFFALFISMLWVATGQGAYLGVGLALFVAGAYGAYSAFNHVKTRVLVWIDPWSRQADQGYQLAQAAYAFGSGGFAGSGVGLGRPGNIPAATTDFIFAAIGEELGLLGAAAILVAFVLMVGAGLRIAARAEPPFEKLLAAGLTTILAVQTFIIIGGVTRLVPLTGITLPFISYGGSSLIANYVLLALLLRISDDTARRARRAATEAAVQSDDTVLKSA
jgi:cell division protein FtsW (lipid II flippase)